MAACVTARATRIVGSGISHQNLFLAFHETEHGAFQERLCPPGVPHGLAVLRGSYAEGFRLRRQGFVEDTPWQGRLAADGEVEKISLKTDGAFARAHFSRPFSSTPFKDHAKKKRRASLRRPR